MNWSEVPEFWQGVIAAVVVIFFLEAISLMVQAAVLVHRRRTVPSYRFRSWWERTVSDRLYRRLNLPTAADHRALRAPKALERHEKRAEHARARLVARYPTLRYVDPPPLAERRSGPASAMPRFGRPRLMENISGQYVEPLRCSTVSLCDGRPLAEGERFWAVPTGETPDAPFIVVCRLCASPSEELVV